MEGTHRRAQQKGYKTYTEVQEKAYTQEPSVMKSEVRKALWEIAGNKAAGVESCQ
jgi:hypothetical protein